MRLAILSARRMSANAQLLAAMPIAGRTLIERQIDLATARAEEVHILVLVEAMPAEIAVPLARARQSGISLTIVRGIDEIIPHLSDADHALVLRDGVLIKSTVVTALERAAENDSAALGQTVSAGPGTAIDRLDDNHVSAGAALYSGDQMRSAIHDIAAWDLDLSLPRAVRQYGGLSVVPAGLADVVNGDDGIATLERWLFSGETQGGATGMLRPVIIWLGRSPVQANWLRIGAAGFALGAVPAFALGWLWLACAMALSSCLLMPLGNRLAQLKPTASPERIFRWLSPPMAEFGWYAALASLGGLAQGVIGLATCAAILIDRRTERIAARAEQQTTGAGLGETVLRLAILIPVMAMTDTAWGVAAAGLITGISILVRQDRLLRKRP